MSLFPTKCPWRQYQWIQRMYDETNDCAVVALAQTTGITYQDAHRACKREGRVNRGGMYMTELRRAFDRLGFTLDPYPFEGKTLNTVVLSLPNCASFLINTTNHFTAYVNGKWLDHTPINRRRAVNVYQVIKNENKNKRH